MVHTIEIYLTCDVTLNVYSIGSEAVQLRSKTPVSCEMAFLENVVAAYTILPVKP